jgi:hypothetical protein
MTSFDSRSILIFFFIAAVSMDAMLFFSVRCLSDLMSLISAERITIITCFDVK